MAHYVITKGKNIPLKGSPEKNIVTLALPTKVAVQPTNFHGAKYRVLVTEGALVKAGTPVLEERHHPAIKFVSPVSGKVSAIVRGEKRALLAIEIQPDGKNTSEEFAKHSIASIKNLSKENVVSQILSAGLWPAFRQRPFSKLANPASEPKAIFVRAMATDPLSLDIDYILQGQEEAFQAGLEVLMRLTPKVHLCYAPTAVSKALTLAQGVDKHTFEGPHPAGNVSVHIHHISPINKGEIVWYLEAQDVVRLGMLFLKGIYHSTQYIAVGGQGADKRYYAKTVLGVPMNHLTSAKTGMRYISGSVLSGDNVTNNGYVRYFDSQVSVIPEGGKREFLGWINPGFNKYSFSRTVASSFLPTKEVSLDTDENGSHRAIVLNHLYDKYVPLDIMTYFLIKAIWVGDTDEAVRLGILECDPEDFALATFACPSKVDVGGIIRQGLEQIEIEEAPVVH